MATLLPEGKQSFVNSAGAPLVGGKLYTYDAGTNTPRATYSDAAGTVPNTNPVILDARGEATVFWSGSYKVVLKDAAGTTVWTVDGIVSTDTYSSTAVGALTAALASSAGGTFVGWIQAGVGAVFRWVRDKLRERVSVTDFGAVGDGVTDDTAAIQAAINYCGLAGSPKKLIIPYGAAGVYKLTNAVFVNVGGLTIEWENNGIVLKKFYSALGATGPGMGNLIVVNAAYVVLVNPGIDGNGANYGGSGIAYNRADTYFTYGCRIVNPNIKNTRDSCVVFAGPRGAPDIVIEGGGMSTWQDPAFAGASSSGFPAMRIVGAFDNDPSPRVFTGITSSSSILLDATGMNCFKMSDCFTGTILYQGNPDVTGGVDPLRTGESAVVNTYIRDGIVLAGFENSVDLCLSHGNTPLTWTAYGGKPLTYSAVGWEISANSQLCKLGPSNIVTSGIIDKSPQGVATGLLSSLYQQAQPWSINWTTSGGSPAIGNGNIYANFENAGASITARFAFTIGSTTALGTGQWYFDLPRWMNTNIPAVGKFAFFRVGFGWTTGVLVLSSTGGIHKVSPVCADGNYLTSAYPAGGFPAGTVLCFEITYLRG